MSCPDCYKGTLRSEVALTGTEEVIHGIPTYVARPEAGVDSRGTIVILPDAFGWKTHNTRALADAYAKRLPGVVYAPEFMNGMSGLGSWRVSCSYHYTGPPHP